MEATWIKVKLLQSSIIEDARERPLCSRLLIVAEGFPGIILYSYYKLVLQFYFCQRPSVKADALAHGDGVIDSEVASGKASSNGDVIDADVAPKRVSDPWYFGVGGHVGDSWFDGSSTVAGRHGEWRCGGRSTSLGMTGTETTARPQGAMVEV